MSTSTSHSNSYTIRQVSPWRYVVTALVTLFGGMLLMLYLKELGVLPHGGPWIAVLIVALLGLMLLSAKYIATATTVIIIDDESVRRVWKTQFLGHWRPDEAVRWADITEYRYQAEKNHEVFKITVADGRVIKVLRSWQGGKDDFTRFRKDFVQKVEELNRHQQRGDAKIRIGRSFYESKTAYILAIVGVAFLIIASLTVLILSFYRELHFGNFVSLGAGYTAILYFVAMVYSQRQTRKELEASESSSE